MTNTIWLVHVSHYDDHGGGAYATEDAAAAAKEWFEKHGHGPAFVHELPLNEGFEPPAAFHANYLSWGYQNGGSERDGGEHQLPEAVWEPYHARFRDGRFQLRREDGTITVLAERELPHLNPDTERLSLEILPTEDDVVARLAALDRGESWELSCAR